MWLNCERIDLSHGSKRARELRCVLRFSRNFNEMFDSSTRTSHTSQLEMDYNKNKEFFLSSSSQFVTSSSTLANIRIQLLLKIFFLHFKTSQPQKFVIYVDERFELPLGVVNNNQCFPWFNPSLLAFIVPLQRHIPPTPKHIDAESLFFFLRVYISLSLSISIFISSNEVVQRSFSLFFCVDGELSTWEQTIESLVRAHKHVHKCVLYCTFPPSAQSSFHSSNTSNPYL